MVEEITDANTVVVKIGTSKAGGADGALIIDDFEFSVTPNHERKYGVGNESAKGRTSGNEEVDLSFTHIGQNTDLVSDIEDGNFDIVMQGDNHKWELDNSKGAFTVSVSDGGDYEFEFDGDALDYDRTTLGDDSGE